MDTNVSCSTINDNNVCRNCGKKLPASKFCMHCGCNNNDNAPVATNNKEDDVHNNVDDNKNVENVSTNKNLIMPIAGLTISLILICVGFLFGGFSGLFSGMAISDNSLSASVKILSDSNKVIYYLKNEKIYTFDAYVDKEKIEEDSDLEKEKYFPSENNSNFLDEINKNKIIDFDFTNGTDEYTNTMLFLSDEKLFIVDNGVIETITLTSDIKSNSAAVTYFNYMISTELVGSNYVNEKNYKYFDYDESGYDEKLYVMDEDGNFSYYENYGYFSSSKVIEQKIELKDFNAKGKKLYYSDNGTFIFGDSENIYILDKKGIVYKNNGIKYDGKTINILDIKHIFKYDITDFGVVTNNGKIYYLSFNSFDGEFMDSNASSDTDDNSFVSNIESVFKSISLKSLDLKSIISLLILLGSFILLSVNLYIKMYSNYFTKLFSSTLILGVALSIYYLIYMYSYLEFKDIILLIFKNFGIGFIISNIFISFTEAIVFLLNKINVNTIINYILAFILFIVLLLVSLEYNMIFVFLLTIHIFWYVYAVNDILCDKTNDNVDKKIYNIVSYGTLAIVLIGLLLGYLLLPEVKKENVILLLPYIVCLLSVLAPSIYLQKNFDIYMFLKMIFMGIFMYFTPSIISYIINIFSGLGDTQDAVKLLGNNFKLTIIIIVLIVSIIALCTFVHVLTRFITLLISDKIKINGFVLKTSLALLFYVIFGLTAFSFGIPLIVELMKFLLKLFFGEEVMGLLSLLL